MANPDINSIIREPRITVIQTVSETEKNEFSQIQLSKVDIDDQKVTNELNFDSKKVSILYNKSDSKKLPLLSDRLLTMVFFDLILPMLGELVPTYTVEIKTLFQQQKTLKAKRKIVDRSSHFLKMAIEKRQSHSDNEQ